MAGFLSKKLQKKLYNALRYVQNALRYVYIALRYVQNTLCYIEFSEESKIFSLGFVGFEVRDGKLKNSVTEGWIKRACGAYSAD